jgi:hypothetical protein
VELKVEITIVIDREETKGLLPQQVTTMITNAIELGLENTGVCRSCLITIKPNGSTFSN